MTQQIPPPPGPGWPAAGPWQGGPGYPGGDPIAQAKAEKAYRKAARPWYKKKRFWLLGFVVLVMVVGVSSGGGSDSKPASTPTAESGGGGVKSSQSDAAKNVAVTSCTVQDILGTKLATVGYTVNNPTSKSSNYLLEFSVIDSTSASVGTANGIENNVLPGRPSLGEAIGDISSSAVGPYTCQVGGNITRIAVN